ncbi:hypothetical protein Tco_1355809 [Tanacetum coccineum]
MNVPVALDHFPVNALTSKVFSFMVKKGKHFSGKVTSLFASMLIQPTKDEGNEGDMTHHRAWMKNVSLKKRLTGKKSKESVSKQGRKSAKAEPSVHKDPLFNELDDDEIDNMETENAQGMGRTRYVLQEEKERKEKEVSTEDVVSTDKEKVSTDRSRVSTDKQIVSNDKQKDSTDRPNEGTVDQTEGRSASPTTPTSTPTIFGDDETIA